MNDMSTPASGTIYIQDAQLEQGLVATDYIETTTTAVSVGPVANLPRIDYTGGGCGKLLLEPQRTNLVTQSEYFAAPLWSYYSFSGGSLVRTFGYESPSGTNDAYKFDVIIGTGGILLTENITATASVDYTLSVWMKGEVGGEKVQIDFKSTASSGPSGTNFTLTTEWERYDVSVTNDTGTSRGFQFRCTASNVPSDQTFYVWGAQVEQGSYPTSYIPTYGAASTRGADACSKTGISSLIGQTEGTLFAEFDIDSAVNTEGYIARIDDSSFNDTIYIVRSAISATLTMALRSGGSAIASSVLAGVSGRNKAAIAYKSGQFAFYLNGTQLGTSLATYTNGITYNDFRIGGFLAATANMAGGIHQALLFKTRLSNSELASLTTL